MEAQVVVSLQMDGIHSWPSCPFEEVAFLRNEHRHVFHIKCWKNVRHNDRDVEIIMLKRRIQETMIEYWGEPSKNPGVRMPILKFGAMSCEMIAEKLIHTFDLSSCEVLEDGENGALISC